MSKARNINPQGRAVKIAPDNAAYLLTKTAEYALRLMAILAREYRSGLPLKSRDLAHEANVPAAYVSKILRRLVVDGLLHAEKGHGGGFSLTRPPAKIRFSDIFTALGEGFEGNRCAFGWGACNAKNPCMLHQRWTELKASLEKWAHSSTLDKLF